MNTRATVLTILGVVVSFLGILWTVQGLGIVQIDPVLCATECEPITGRSAQWALTGVITLFAGVVIVRTGLYRMNR
ncbi:hypothetical protein SAMN05216285_3149 [Natrinema salifodinae]|uniref:Uncharacterized protein n=1 Tax=Natrinema salifodinae TaxID=1202768 RepID=A0A1I0Q6S2_9EURY|nr:hypothetical protein SAMN05216285_3149 [Natrinema salifodinae]